MQLQRLGSLLAAVLLLGPAACVKGNPFTPSDADGGPGDLPLEGGTIAIPQCGTTMTTRFGASAPVDAPDTLGDDPTPKHVHLGLAGPATSSIVVSWRTNDDTTASTIVQYGKASVAEHEQRGLTFVYTTGFGSDGPRVRMHETHLCGLEADTVYKYRVGGRDDAGEEHWSPEYTFRTAPDFTKDPSASVSVLVLGDTRDGYDTWGQLLAKGQELASPDLVLFTGDAVTLGQLQAEWDAFFGAGEAVLHSVPMVAAHGNHDTNSVNFFSQFAMPGDEQNFGFDYGPFYVFVANDSPEDVGDLETVIPQKLSAGLAEASARAVPWKFTLQHRPLYSAAGNHGSDQLLQMVWGPILDQHQVDVAIAGHDHNYERSLPMRGHQVKSSFADGTMYLVAGSAGVSLYDNGSDFWTAKSEKTMNMVVFTLRKGLLEMTAYRPDGTTIESLSITKP